MGGLAGKIVTGAGTGIGRGIPFARPQEPEDISPAVAFVASERARNIPAESANVSVGQINR